MTCGHCPRPLPPLQQQDTVAQKSERWVMSFIRYAETNQLLVKTREKKIFAGRRIKKRRYITVNDH